jgi:hypothetical protein
MDGVGFPVCTRYVLSLLSTEYYPERDQQHPQQISKEPFQGGLTVSKMRHNLSDASVRSGTVLGSWSKFPGLIPQSKLAGIFNNKHKRPKVNVKDTEVAGVPEEAAEEIVD